MLQELRIINFAIVDTLELDFADGFNVITGETGAGKSIIIDAVELLLGSRADSSMVRANAERAVVEGVFKLSPQVQIALTPILKREDLQDDDDPAYITLSREIRRVGRSAARINGVTVTLDVLSEVGDFLVDVHGQSEHLSLLRPRNHLDLLDRFADLIEVRDGLSNVVERLNALRRELRDLLENEAALKRRAELLQEEIDEIEAANLEVGEDDDLNTERNRLANAEQLATLTSGVAMLLTGDPDAVVEQLSAVDQLQEAASLLEKLARIDNDLDEDQKLAESLSEQAQELASNVRSYGESVEYNPGRLEEVEERLEALNTLKRRYGGSIQAVIDYQAQASEELVGITHRDKKIAELRDEETKILRHIGELASRISKARQRAGRELSKRIVKELGDLRMKNTTFEVSIMQREDENNGCYMNDTRIAFDSSGVDSVEFMMSANPGEPLRPLAKVASGGETARIMLAMKRVLTQADQTPTLIFDEIDQGIGGRVGAVVGEKLWSLSVNHQVLVVTHMPQIAGFADKHFRVEKITSGKRTKTDVLWLKEEQERVDELADMLGTGTDSGAQSARDLLAQAASRKLDRALEGAGPLKQADLFDD